MFTSPHHMVSAEKLPHSEMLRRHKLCQELAQKLIPKAGGILVFSRLAIYYLTGAYAHGVFWLPLQGNTENALLMLYEHKNDLSANSVMDLYASQSPLKNIVSLSSFSDIPKRCHEQSLPLSPIVAAEMNSLPWNLARKVQNELKDVQDFLSIDTVLLQARSRKSPWELNKMRIAGARHQEAICHLLPQRMHFGMNERELALLSWEIFFSLGHHGINRMGNFGEECFLGHIAVGDNGNYPSHFNGPLGLKGEHPALPYMGDANTVWQKNQLLAMDIGYSLEGYHTDKTQVYYSGKIAALPYDVRKAHDACIEIQQKAAESLKTGAIPSEIWNNAKELAQKHGISEGFMGCGGNQVPFLGHGIGLVIDEYPVLAQRFDEPLQENMTIAIEPKVGIAGVGMVGVENTFVVTSTGGVSITGEDYNIIEVD